jgi:hypothetical protein
MKGRNVQTENIVGEVFSGDPVIRFCEGGEVRVEEQEFGKILAAKNFSG